MRDIVKTNVKREQNRKRKRRRRRHRGFYVFLTIILVIGIGVLLSMTLLFNVKTIEVNGDVDYNKEDIIRMSGINVGDNLVRLDSNKAEQGILSTMIYIESAEVDKQYPKKIAINVTKCIPTANIACEDGYLLVSAKGKILEKTEEKTGGLLLIEGFEPESETLGTFLKSKDSQKDSIAQRFLEISGREQIHKITSVDLSDKYEISIVYGNRITFEMGTSNDLDYKLDLASTVLDDVNEDKKGYMTMIGTNQISFREEEGIEKTENHKIPISEEIVAMTENIEGNTELYEEITETDVLSEGNTEQYQ